MKRKVAGCSRCRQADTAPSHWQPWSAGAPPPSRLSARSEPVSQAQTSADSLHTAKQSTGASTPPSKLPDALHLAAWWLLWVQQQERTSSAERVALPLASWGSVSRRWCHSSCISPTSACASRNRSCLSVTSTYKARLLSSLPEQLACEGASAPATSAHVLQC